MKTLFIATLLITGAVAAHADPLPQTRADSAQKPVQCKPGTDGSYSEIVTTMASVLPPAEGDALLRKHCDECNLQKLGMKR